MEPLSSYRGQFLIATPELRDPNFTESVVLICEHNENGAFGLIINRKADLKVRPRFEGIEGHDWIEHQEIFFGGPVHPDQVVVLYRSNPPPRSPAGLLWTISCWLPHWPSSPVPLNRMAKSTMCVSTLVVPVGTASSWKQRFSMVHGGSSPHVWRWCSGKIPVASGAITSVGSAAAIPFSERCRHLRTFWTIDTESMGRRV